MTKTVSGVKIDLSWYVNQYGVEPSGLTTEFQVRDGSCGFSGKLPFDNVLERVAALANERGVTTATLINAY